MRLLYGTYNPAKLDIMRRWLSDIPGLELVSLSELETPPEDVEETGSTPLENARIKAIAYCAASGMPTLAADSALYIEGLTDDQQPGVHARRMKKSRMDDDEMTAYYASLVHGLGGRAKAQYRNALCIAFPGGRCYERFDDTVASLPFLLVDTPHQRRTKGFPLDALSVDIASGQYYYDMDENRVDGDLAQGDGYRRFVCDALEVDA